MRNPSREVEEFVIESLGREISDVEFVDNGVDYYVRDKGEARKVGRNVRSRFGGEFDLSSTLYTKDHQTSKEVYRDTVLVRIPNFSLGDVVRVDDKLIRITGMGKKVSGDDLETGKKEIFEYPEEAEVLEEKETRVVQTEPHLEVLHPDTYQATQPRNEAEEELRVDDQVEVVVSDGVWII